jgi:hypothetical protein
MLSHPAFIFKIRLLLLLPLQVHMLLHLSFSSYDFCLCVFVFLFAFASGRRPRGMRTFACHFVLILTSLACELPFASLAFASALLPWFCTLTLLLQPTQKQG